MDSTLSTTQETQSVTPEKAPDCEHRLEDIWPDLNVRGLHRLPEEFGNSLPSAESHLVPVQSL